ncbi:MAG TPA: dTDP-4-dehydrorhamnose 3,5-epimerase [Anaerolineae bacterium]|jgi:dTDP-4-dehydrorhamnose 3,5-epimerase
MKFTELPLAGAYLIEPEQVVDERGFFARAWSHEEFEQRGLVTKLVQCNISYNKHTGTLRGMHYQAPPYAEVKVLRCTMGAVYDVIIDLRPASPTYRQWHGVTMDSTNRLIVYIPEGFAHGFVTLTDNAEVFYQMSESYHPEQARGVRWNDAAFGIRWPMEPRVISERDRLYPDFK